MHGRGCQVEINRCCDHIGQQEGHILAFRRRQQDPLVIGHGAGKVDKRLAASIAHAARSGDLQRACGDIGVFNAGLGRGDRLQQARRKAKQQLVRRPDLDRPRHLRDFSRRQGDRIAAVIGRSQAAIGGVETAQLFGARQHQGLNLQIDRGLFIHRSRDPSHPRRQIGRPQRGNLFVRSHHDSRGIAQNIGEMRLALQAAPLPIGLIFAGAGRRQAVKRILNLRIRAGVGGQLQIGPNRRQKLIGGARVHNLNVVAVQNRARVDDQHHIFAWRTDRENTQIAGNFAQSHRAGRRDGQGIGRLRAGINPQGDQSAANAAALRIKHNRAARDQAGTGGNNRFFRCDINAFARLQRGSAIGNIAHCADGSNDQIPRNRRQIDRARRRGIQHSPRQSAGKLDLQRCALRANRPAGRQSDDLAAHRRRLPCRLGGRGGDAACGDKTCRAGLVVQIARNQNIGRTSIDRNITRRIKQKVNANRAISQNALLISCGGARGPLIFVMIGLFTVPCLADTITLRQPARVRGRHRRTGIGIIHARIRTGLITVTSKCIGIFIEILRAFDQFRAQLH